MRSARTEAFWQSYRRHQGIGPCHYQTASFRTAPEVAANLLQQMVAGAKRGVSAAVDYFGEGKEYFVPRPGDHTILLDHRGRPRLIWRATGVTIRPLSSVTNAFVWRDGTGNGDRAEWLRLVRASMTIQARRYGFEMHDDIATLFATVEVVWPNETANRLSLVTPLLDRGIALLERLENQNGFLTDLEAVMARIQTAVLTVGQTRQLGFTNAAAETLLRRGDGLQVKNGKLTAPRAEDEKALSTAIAAVCAVNDTTTPRSSRQMPEGVGKLVRIGRRDSKPGYRVSVFPLRPGAATGGLTAVTRAVLFVDDPVDDLQPSQADYYSRAFLLTPTEARLASQLGSGGTLTEAADRLGMAYNTARVHLRSIFDKTDTHRQTELVRLLRTYHSLRLALS